MSLFSIKQNNKRGFALFIAVITAGILLLIAVAISDLSYKEQIITISAKESKEAFYAADTGLECALYWDVIHGNFVEGGDGNEITCSGETEVISSQMGVGKDGSVGPIEFGGAGGSDYCFTITVEKAYNPTDGVTDTCITSFGYNNCNTSDPRRLERALEVKYGHAIPAC